MHPKSSATQALVLDRLPSGELAWLRLSTQPIARADDPHPRHVLIQKGRDPAGPRPHHGSAVRSWLVLDQLTATVRHDTPVCAPRSDTLLWKTRGEGRFIVQQAGSPEFATMSARREELRYRRHKPHAVTSCARERAVVEVVR